MSECVCLFVCEGQSDSLLVTTAFMRFISVWPKCYAFCAMLLLFFCVVVVDVPRKVLAMFPHRNILVVCLFVVVVALVLH